MTEPDTQLQQLLTANRERLKRSVRSRMDARLNSRVDPSDVIQEAFTEAARRYEDRDATVPGFVWLRFLTLQKLHELHRKHCDVQARAVGREVPIGGNVELSASHDELANELAASSTSPGDRAANNEIRSKLREALEQLDPVSCEILTLRHLDQLTGVEAAAVLGISVSAASKRYVRAVEQLRSQVAGLWE